MAKAEFIREAKENFEKILRYLISVSYKGEINHFDPQYPESFWIFLCT